MLYPCSVCCQEELCIAILEAYVRHLILTKQTQLIATYVASLAAVARAEWDSDRWTARLLGLLGKDEPIEDQITWKRALKSQGSFDTERFKQEYPDLYAQYLRPESHSVAVDSHSHRPYPLAD